MTSPSRLRRRARRAGMERKTYTVTQVRELLKQQQVEREALALRIHDAARRVEPLRIERAVVKRERRRQLRRQRPASEE